MKIDAGFFSTLSRTVAGARRASRQGSRGRRLVFAELRKTAKCFLIFEKGFALGCRSAVVHPKLFQDLTVPLDFGHEKCYALLVVAPIFLGEAEEKVRCRPRYLASDAQV